MKESGGAAEPLPNGDYDCKVTRAEAITLQDRLAPQIRSRRFAFTGLGLHLYRNPHWEEVGQWRFRGKEGG